MGLAQALLDGQIILVDSISSICLLTFLGQQKGYDELVASLAPVSILNLSSQSLFP